MEQVSLKSMQMTLNGVHVKSSIIMAIDTEKIKGLQRENNKVHIEKSEDLSVVFALYSMQFPLLT